jgi:hypothetical protein
MFWLLLASFQRLVGGGGGKYKRFPLLPLEAAGTTNEPNSFSNLCELSPTTLCEVYVIYEKS